jgi:hypothetical protein
MSSLNFYYRNIDPEIVERLPTNKKDKARLLLIKKYLLKNYINNFEKETEMKNIFLVKNTLKMFKISAAFGFIFNFICYKFLFTGIYEIRHFYFDPKNVPFIVKLGFTTFLSYKLLDNLWSNYIYIPEIYEMAINDYNQNLNIDKLDIIKNKL